MAVKKSVSKAKGKVTEVINQAKEQAKASLKILESIPLDRKALTNEKILVSLKKMGVATADDVESLRLRIERLEGELNVLKSKSTERGTQIP